MGSIACFCVYEVPNLRVNQSQASTVSIACSPICNLSAPGRRPQAAIPGPWARAQGQPDCSWKRKGDSSVCPAIDGLARVLSSCPMQSRFHSRIDASVADPHRLVGAPAPGSSPSPCIWDSLLASKRCPPFGRTGWHARATFWRYLKFLIWPQSSILSKRLCLDEK